MRTKVLMLAGVLGYVGAVGACATDPAAASTATAQALMRGDPAEALRLADEGLSSSGDDPWLLYQKGDALGWLGRTDEAVAVLRQAEARFPATELHGRSVAAYRRAIAYEFAGRCAEAGPEFAHYADIVRPSAPWLAHDALAHVDACTPLPGGPTIAQARPPELARLGK